MHVARRLIGSFTICFLNFCLPIAAAEAAAPAALKSEIAESRLEPAGAVAAASISLNAGLARLELRQGVLLPASRIGGKVVEMVFLGSGRISVTPPDEIEAGQLELFTGGRKLDEEFDQAVLVVGLDAAAAALLRRTHVAPSPEQAQEGAKVYARWKGSPERRQLHVEGGILINAAGDPSYQGFFAGWFHGKTQGDFLYLVEPGEREQVTLGQFVHLDASEKEKRKLLRQIHREQRRGRLIGVEVENLGQWNNWLSAALRNKEGKPAPGVEPFEPSKYTLDVRLSDNAETLSGRARIDLAPLVVGARALNLRLDSDLAVSAVADGAGAGLVFLRSGRDLSVLLPSAPGKGETAAVVIDYSGKVITKEGRSFELTDTQEWYPRTGTGDHAAYDVTFHWPHNLDLLACGRRAGGGEGKDGERWERRVVEAPINGFGFEVGHFRIEKLKAGHVEITLALDPGGANLTSKARDDISAALTESLAYFEQVFGPLPLDQLTVVTAPRGFSQSMFGFITLSDLMMADLGFFNLLLGLEDRRTVIAHEVAHQWWGHLVGWESYRDQWISEAMANYAAVLYERNRLKGKDKEFHLGPTSGWQHALTHATADGRPYESIGPVVLGSRLLSSKSGDAYTAIVYKKGAVILDMLASTLTEEKFLSVLHQLVAEVDRRAVSTEAFLALITRFADLDLRWFADRYVYGTGLPEVYYTYRFERDEGAGAWTAKVAARQKAPYRFRYRVVRSPEGRLDVARERLDQASVAEALLVVPVEVAIYDPARPPAKTKRKGGDKAANATYVGRVLLRGESSDLALKIPKEPKGLWLDPQHRVFGRFFNESRSPKRVLMVQGFDAANAGHAAEAEALFERARAAPVEVVEEGGSDKGDLKKEGRILDGEIDLGLARLHLGQGKDAQAEKELDQARNPATDAGGWMAEEAKVLEARLAMRRGDFNRAFRRLHGGIFAGSGVDSTEGRLLLAIAAQATGRKDDLAEAMKALKDSGAEMALLAGK
jgi:hypothetical protein